MEFATYFKMTLVLIVSILVMSVSGSNAHNAAKESTFPASSITEGANIQMQRNLEWGTSGNGRIDEQTAYADLKTTADNAKDTEEFFGQSFQEVIETDTIVSTAAARVLTVTGNNDHCVDYTYSCTTCHTGYHVASNQCVANHCNCDNGVAAVGNLCTTDNDNICHTCNSGYNLSGTNCIAPCECAGVSNRHEHGATCSRHSTTSGTKPFCYVHMANCRGILNDLTESTSSVFASGTIGYSYDICQPNKTYINGKKISKN